MDQTRQIDAFLRAIPVPVVAVDRHARITAANSGARCLLGPDLLDRPFVTVLRHPGIIEALDWVLDPDRHPMPMQDPALTPPSDGAVALRAAISSGGREHNCDVTVSPLPPGMGRGALIAVVDRSGVDEAELIRRDFVANVSHELRTPLTALIGFIETLRGPARNDVAARDRFLDIMEREAERMNRLVGDLLSLSRVEANERHRPSARVDLAGLLRGVAASLGPTATRASVTIELDGLDDAIPVLGDHDQLTQLFQNLIANAVKYGGAGGWVGISIASIDHEPKLRGPAWAVTIADRGEGIEAFHLPRLTERFYRIDTHRSREQGGTGLGLAIVKHIVNRHRGRLRIESEKGKGSRFTVILPRQTA